MQHLYVSTPIHEKTIQFDLRICFSWGGSLKLANKHKFFRISVAGFGNQKMTFSPKKMGSFGNQESCKMTRKNPQQFKGFGSPWSFRNVPFVGGEICEKTWEVKGLVHLQIRTTHRKVKENDLNQSSMCKMLTVRGVFFCIHGRGRRCVLISRHCFQQAGTVSNRELERQLGGGFKYFFFPPLPGEDYHFD